MHPFIYLICRISKEVRIMSCHCAHLVFTQKKAYHAYTLYTCIGLVFFLHSLISYGAYNNSFFPTNHIPVFANKDSGARGKHAFKIIKAIR